MAKLDKIDLRTLYELDKDCRVSISTIAKIIHKSPQYVKYRIKRLREENIIKTVTFFTPLSQNVTQNYAFIKLKGSGVIEEKLLLDFLFKMPQTYRLYFCDGEFDIVATFLTKNIMQLDDIKETLSNNFPNIENIFFNHVGFSEIHTKKYLQDTHKVSTIHLKESAENPDSLTKSVLSELKKNPFGRK